MFTLPFKYFYLITSLFFLLIWFVIFRRLKGLRKHILILSLLTASFGPISEFWYFADYWQPDIALPLPFLGGVEDLIFGFAIGGIAAFIFEALFVKKLCYCESKKLKRDWFLFIFFIVEGFFMIVFNNLLGINSIFASSLGMVVLAIVMFAMRKDLIVNALSSAVLVAGVMFVIYFLGQIFSPNAHLWMSRIWKLYGRPEGILILKHIPLTEMIWGFSWGLIWGPMYEFLVGARIVKLKYFK
ncbi:MAG: lycopene cyclase domain-containing protein [Patescibacteria group bacterium]